MSLPCPPRLGSVTAALGGLRRKQMNEHALRQENHDNRRLLHEFAGKK